MDAGAARAADAGCAAAVVVVVEAARKFVANNNKPAYLYARIGGDRGKGRDDQYVVSGNPPVCGPFVVAVPGDSDDVISKRVARLVAATTTDLSCG